MSGKGDVLQRSGRCLREGVSDPIDEGLPLPPPRRTRGTNNTEAKSNFPVLEKTSSQKGNRQAEKSRRDGKPTTVCICVFTAEEFGDWVGGEGEGRGRGGDHMTSWLASHSDTPLPRTHVGKTREDVEQKVNGASASVLRQRSSRKIIQSSLVPAL